MANTIALAKKYLPLLDEVYKMSAKTSVLDAPSALVREGMTANSILIPKIALQGLADYNTASGFVGGDVTFAWETHTFSQDRGRTFSIDAVENMETLDAAFAAVTGQFIRTRVVPEVDAYRFATMAAKAGNVVAAGATLAASTAMQAIDTGVQALMDDEVEKERLICFVTPEIYTYLKQSSLIARQFMVNVGNKVINRDIETLDGMPVVVVPQNRFYTAITQYDGVTGGQEDGGYIKNVATGKDINFMLVDPQAVLSITKTALPRIFDPETNQSANAWKYDYRLYHDIFVPDNKVNGIYLHHKA